MDKSRININPAFLLFAMTFLFSGCSIDEIFRTKEEFEFSLPEYENVKSWQIEVFDGESEESFELKPDDSEKKEASGKQKITLELEKNIPVSVLAFPVFDEEKFSAFPEDFFEPAGAVFPFSRKISFENGFEAEILKDFYTHGKQAGNSSEEMRAFAERFNWKKLHDERLKKASELEFYNPWYCDREKIEELISGGSFSVTYVDEEKCFFVETEVILEELEKYDEGKNCSGTEADQPAYRNSFSDEKPEIFSPYLPETEFIENKGKVFLPESGVFFLLVKRNTDTIFVSGKVLNASKKSLALSFFTL